jgi:DNA-binding CsgD family transcriptional regulator
LPWIKDFKRKETSTMLKTSPRAAAAHLKTIFSKLNVNSRAEATMEALRIGLMKV